MGRPIARLLVCVFVIDGPALGSLVVGAAVGLLLLQVLPERPAHTH